MQELVKQDYVGMVIMVGVCVFIMLILFFRNKAMWIANCMLRMVVGALTIYLCNHWMEEQHILGRVGFNGISLLTCAFLGIPGVVALYGIRFFLSL